MKPKFTTSREEELYNALKELIETISTSRHSIADVSLLQLKVRAVVLKEKLNIK